jgi:outer membrane autotransporter protein
VTGFGDFVNVDGDSSAKGYNFTTGGVDVGIDFRLTPQLTVGIWGGYAHTWTELQPRGSIGVDTGQGGLYASYSVGNFYTEVGAFGGYNSYDMNRPALLGNSKSSPDGDQFGTFVAAGYDFHFGILSIGPIASFQYSYVNLNGFTEQGSIAPLKVSDDSEESLTSDLGLRASLQIKARNVLIRPFLRAAWEHEYNYTSLPVTARLADFSGSAAKFNGTRFGRDSAIVNAGVSVRWTSTFSTYVSYDGQLGRTQFNSNGVSGGLTFLF